MRLLTFTNLYPTDDEAGRGVFVEERLRHLVATGQVSADVLALRPAPTVLLNRRKRALLVQHRHGIAVNIQPVPTLPLLTNWMDPWLWARAAERRARELLSFGADSDVILDGHFLYPDGVGAVLLARRLGLPVVISARGSDVNVKCQSQVMRAWVRWAAAHSSALITVSRALAEKLNRLDIRAPILEVVPNGVDLTLFRPFDREPGLRAADGTKRVIASVGHLVPGKGHDIVIGAIASLPDVTLLIVGSGPERARLQQQALRLGVASRVRFLGAVPHEQMPEIYNQADALALASANEGMPNVVLESLACGTRVVATDVGGVGEVMNSPSAGLLVQERSSEAFRDAIARVFRLDISMEQTRRFAQRFAWGAVVNEQLSVYRRVLATRSEQVKQTGLEAR